MKSNVKMISFSYTNETSREQGSHKEKRHDAFYLINRVFLPYCFFQFYGPRQCESHGTYIRW